ARVGNECLGEKTRIEPLDQPYTECGYPEPGPERRINPVKSAPEETGSRVLASAGRIRAGRDTIAADHEKERHPNPKPVDDRYNTGQRSGAVWKSDAVPGGQGMKSHYEEAGDATPEGQRLIARGFWLSRVTITARG